MSFQEAASKLSPPLKDLVQNFTAENALGKTEKDQAEVVGWIEKVGSGHVQESAFQDLDAELTPRTYIVNNYLTAADVALYGALHPAYSQLQPPQYYARPALTRYFDHIQSLPSVRASADPLAPAFPPLVFDIENAPRAERKADPPKEKKKAAKPSVADASAAEKVPELAVPALDSKVQEGTPQRKEKKEKKKEATAGAEEGGKKKGGKAPAAPAEDAGAPVPSMIDLRVGHIVDIKKHPDADGLYIEQIDIGEETGPRTVVSGLVNYIPIEQMRDKYLVAVCNLKPANMRGVKSFAMVLCATSKDGKDAGIELVQPPAGSKPGEKVYFEGPNYENATPLSQLNPKKKIFETIQPGFTTLETKEAAWVDPATGSVHRIRTKDGVCVAPTFVGASLS